MPSVASLKKKKSRGETYYFSLIYGGIFLIKTFLFYQFFTGIFRRRLLRANRCSYVCMHVCMDKAHSY